MKIETIEWVLELALKYGIPAVRAIINTLETEEITAEELEAKLAAARDPEDYFEGSEA